MNLFFWRKTPAQPPPERVTVNHLQFLVEQEGETSLLTTKEFEKKFSIAYVPHLDFPKWTDYQKIVGKTAKYHQKGFLDHDQLWLGAYFKKEILSAAVPPIRLRWIGDRLGWGVFAERDLKPMEFVGEYAGLVRKRKSIDSRNSYCFEYAIVSDEKNPYTIDALDQGSITRFINHSDSPNLVSAIATLNDLSHIVLYAKRAIRKGEQLCYSYGRDYWKKRLPPNKI